jgi:hypothetical protein
MFESEAPVEKGNKLTMLLVVGSVMAVLGVVTWYFTH